MIRVTQMVTSVSLFSLALILLVLDQSGGPISSEIVLRLFGILSGCQVRRWQFVLRGTSWYHDETKRRSPPTQKDSEYNGVQRGTWTELNLTKS